MLTSEAQRSVAVSPHALIGCHGRRCPDAHGGLKAVPIDRFRQPVFENVAVLPTPPRLASPHLARAVPTVPPPVPEADHVAVRAPCPCRACHGRCSVASAVAKSSTVSGAPSTPLPLFLRGLLSRASSTPSTSIQDRRRPPEP
jgi:hypothetical protein